MNDVIMCHGSNYPPHTRRHISATAKTQVGETHEGRTKMSEAMMYSPSVASSEMTIFLKIGLVKIDENESFCAASRFCIPLNASRNAATC